MLKPVPAKCLPLPNAMSMVPLRERQRNRVERLCVMDHQPTGIRSFDDGIKWTPALEHVARAGKASRWTTALSSAARARDARRDGERVELCVIRPSRPAARREFQNVEWFTSLGGRPAERLAKFRGHYKSRASPGTVRWRIGRRAAFAELHRGES
jgi:hypothetical protein